MNIDEVLRTNLTADQAAAASDESRDVLCLACAGSGKSRTLAYRIAHLVAARRVPANAITAFTFTEKAAETIKRRVAGALQAVDLDPAMLGAMYIGTIHAFCQKVLGELDARNRQLDVLDENRLLLFLISRYWDLDIRQLQQARGARYFDTIRAVADAWMFLNDELTDIAAVEAAYPPLGVVLRTLEGRMAAAGYIDFSLMIRRVVEALAAGGAGESETISRLQHLLVDEYQDVNPAQEALISRLRDLGSSVFVVGDDDQAIYAWRGADVGNILSFETRYGASRHTLAHNYRSAEPIVVGADRFAAAELGAQRIAKNPTAENPDGPRDFQQLWFPSRDDEAAWIVGRILQLLGSEYRERDGAGTVRGLTPADFAILMPSTRTNEQNGQPRHAAFTRALQAQGVRFSLEAGGGAFERLQVRALVESFNLLRDGSPTREAADHTFRTVVVPGFPGADFNRYTSVLSAWGREIHAPTTVTRRRVFPQRLVHELLDAFLIQDAGLTDDVMRDIGLFSRIMQDVETVYMSVDSARRFQEILNFLGNVAERGYDTSTDDLVARPDAVTVTTVHKAKGLEFPVVFIADVEQGRFPRSRSGYEGWLPDSVVQPAVARGAYHTTPEGQARLFYTALTRAERYLYVTGCERLPAASRNRRQSQFALRLAHPELRTDRALPDGLRRSAPRRRIEVTDLPTSFSEIRYYLLCPKNYQFRKRYGFSPPIPELFGFGQTIHTGVGRLHQLHRAGTPTGQEAEDVALDVFHLKHVAPSHDSVGRPGPYERAQRRAASIIRTYAETFTTDFQRERQVEARFEVPLDGAVISGAIDLLLRENEAGDIVDAKVIDFKSIEGGGEPESNEEIDWTALALQVQLYALGAREVLGENTRTGAVHFLKDNRRVDVPVDDEAVRAAVRNVEWAVRRIVAGDFPARPQRSKCDGCDFALLCAQNRQDFTTAEQPPPIHLPGGQVMAGAFSLVD